MTAIELVREATEALMRCEAAQLSELANKAPEVEIPGSERDLCEFRISRRALERLLALTPATYTGKATELAKRI